MNIAIDVKVYLLVQNYKRPIVHLCQILNHVLSYKCAETSIYRDRNQWVEVKFAIVLNSS
jgi:hypothetical protein